MLATRGCRLLLLHFCFIIYQFAGGFWLINYLFIRGAHPVCECLIYTRRFTLVLGCLELIRMLFLQAEELKEKEKENHKLVSDLEEKQTKCSKLVNYFFSSQALDFEFLCGSFNWPFMA